MKLSFLKNVSISIKAIYLFFFFLNLASAFVIGSCSADGYNKLVDNQNIYKNEFQAASLHFFLFL